MHPNKKILAVVGVLIIVVVAAVGAYRIYTMPVEAPGTGNEGESVACTMDAKLCPDGSYVGRHGPKCEFAACPTTTSNIKTYQGSVVAVFEGRWELPFAFEYDASKVSVSTTSKPYEFILTSGAHQARIVFSYEGGRGYSSKDYWNEIGKKDCPNCQAINSPFLIPGTAFPLAYTANGKNYIVASTIAGEPWNVYVTYTAADDALLFSLASLHLSQAVRTDAAPKPY